MTLLGVTLTSNLKWDTHIENVISHANSKRRFLTVLHRTGATTANLLKFYVTFIRSSIEYAAPVWHLSTGGCQTAWSVSRAPHCGSFSPTTATDRHWRYQAYQCCTLDARTSAETLCTHSMTITFSAGSPFRGRKSMAAPSRTVPHNYPHLQHHTEMP